MAWTRTSSGQRRAPRQSRRPSSPRSRGCSSPTTSRRCPSDTGYRGPTACNAAGITYRQLDYWARTGLVEPTVRGASGSGSQRLYSFRDILILKVDQAAARRRHLAAADPHGGRSTCASAAPTT